MKTSEIDIAIVNGYFELLGNLSLTNKLDLISKLTVSVKMYLISKKSVFKKAFGAFDSKKNC